MTRRPGRLGRVEARLPTDVPLTDPAPAAAPHARLRAAAVLGATALAWVWVLRRGDAMLNSAPAFVAIWTVMMAAMMLPSQLPGVQLFASLSAARRPFGHRPVPSVVFLAGYLAAWTALGVAVALANRFVEIPPAWRRGAVAAALLLGGAYQLTSLKAWCLGHCREPMSFFVQHWHDGVAGALRMGGHHGLYCVGCCWGLMAALVALGMMNPAWMGVFALGILAEKLARRGQRLAPAMGLVLLLAGALVLLGVVPVGTDAMRGM